MIEFPFTPLIQSLPATIPFVGPETFERQNKQTFKARVGANESAFGISPKARQAMVEAIDRTAWYNDPENFDLRTALAKLYDFTTDHISVGAGIDDLLGLVVRAFLQPGQVTVASLGSYPTYHYHVFGFGAKSHTIPYKNDQNDLVALSEAVHQTQSHLIYIANPDNPTGTCHTASEIQAFLNALPKTCLCILDEAYFEFAPDHALLPMHPHDNRVIRMRTFSKAHGMAGARIGYAIAHPDIITAFDKIRLHFSVNRTAQIGALASLHDTEFIQSVVNAVAEGRRDYENLGRQLGVPTLPSATNFVSFDFGSAENAQSVLEALIQNAIFVRKPMCSPINQLVRVTVGTPQERAIFAETLTGILNT